MRTAYPLTELKGYGTYLMNHLKAYAVKNKCTYIMTIADNMAVGYFRKQVKLRLPPPHGCPDMLNLNSGVLSRYKCACRKKSWDHQGRDGFRRVTLLAADSGQDYVGGVLMECALNPHIDYLHISDMIHKQRQVYQTHHA